MEEPKIEFIRFVEADIITASGGETETEKIPEPRPQDNFTIT